MCESEFLYFSQWVLGTVHSVEKSEKLIFSNFFSKTVNFKKFLSKSVRVQCLTSSQPILLKKNLFSRGFTWL